MFSVAGISLLLLPPHLQTQFVLVSCLRINVVLGLATLEPLGLWMPCCGVQSGHWAYICGHMDAQGTFAIFIPIDARSVPLPFLDLPFFFLCLPILGVSILDLI